jgi:hypothetical protein
MYEGTDLEKNDKEKKLQNMLILTPGVFLNKLNPIILNSNLGESSSKA